MRTRPTHFRWLVVGLLFLITFVNYIDRASIAYAIGDISKTFNFSPEQMGLILGAFGIGYVMTTFLGGMAADRYGSKRTFTFSMLFWGVGSLLTGLANGFIMAYLARVILGFAEGPTFPAMTRAISDWLSEKERNRALALALISVPISLALGGPIVSQLILLFSWRGAFYVLAALVLIWIPIWWWLFQDKPEQSPYVGRMELRHLQEESLILHQEIFASWRYLFFNRTLLANNWAFFVFGYYLFFFMTWLPSYLKTVYHLDLQQIGLYSLMPWLFAALLMYGVGSLSDYLFQKTKSLRLSRSYPIFISQLLSAICILPIILTTKVWVAMIFISLAVGFAMSANAAYYAVNIDVAKKRAGTALGIMDAVFAMAGFIAPTLTGYMISLTGHYEAAFYLMTGLAISSSIFTALFHNRVFRKK